MKTLLRVFILTLLCTAVACAKTIKVNGETFSLGFSNKTSKTALEEYVKKGESVKNWTRLVTIHQFPDVDSPKSYIATVAEIYQKQYPHMKFAVDNSNGAHFMDCIMYPRDGGPKFVEWNFYSARKSAAGGVVVYQYGVRAPYKSDVKEAFEALNAPSLRKRMLPVLKKEWGKAL